MFSYKATVDWMRLDPQRGRLIQLMKMCYHRDDSYGYFITKYAWFKNQWEVSNGYTYYANQLDKSLQKAWHSEKQDDNVTGILSHPTFR